MEAISLDWFFMAVLITGWTVAMGFGAFLAWLFYERHDD